MSDQFRYPEDSFEWTNYLRKPWRLRWRWRSIPTHFGPEFQDYYALLAKSLFWSKSEIEQYQWQKLRALLDHAFRTVPFYQRWSQQHQVTAQEIRTLEDFRRLPIINRAQIDTNLADFTSSEFKQHRGSIASTSGSSGRVLKFYRSWDTESFRRAVLWRHFNQIGYHFKEPRVSLNVAFVGDEADLLYKYEPIDNLVMLNGRFLHPDTAEAIYDVIRRFRPVMFYAHPVALATLSKAMQARGLPPLNIPTVYVYSEVLSRATLNILQKQIGPNIYDHFGNRENSVSASQLGCGNYHINSEFVAMELVPSGQKFEDQALGCVVGTNLVNYAMPVIRYDCGDLASEIKACDRCKIAHPTIRFVGGRDKNFLVSKHGLLHCQYDDFLHKHGIEMPDDIQIEQVDMETLILRMVAGKDYVKERDEPILVGHLRDATKDWFTIRVEYVDNIPQTPGFKKSKVVSRLGAEFLESNRI
jgi:phenylacetate-CoA ligase